MSTSQSSRHVRGVAAATPRQVLDTPLPDGSPAGTVGGLLRQLLTGLWADPGSADMRSKVCSALVRAGFVIGTFDPRGEVERAAIAAADRLVRALIDALTVPPGTPAEHRAQAAVTLSRQMLAAMEVCAMPDPDGVSTLTVEGVLEEWRYSLGVPPETPHDDAARS